MDIKEYIEAKFQEYDSGDANTKEAVINELKSAGEKVEALLRHLEELEAESDLKYNDDEYITAKDNQLYGK